MNPWAAVIGAVLGGVRASGEDARNQRSNRVEITKEQWSPWTKQHGGPIQNADYMGRVMQGASTGMAMGQQMGGQQGGGQPTVANYGANGGQGVAQGQPFNGQGPTMAQQNGAPNSGMGDYSSPNGSGYAPWRGGQGMMLVDPNAGSSPGASRKPVNVASAGAINLYAPRR